MGVPRVIQRDRKKQILTPSEALPRIARYCAYQERTHSEVKDKLLSFGLSTGEADEMLSRMITDGFVNEERFAKAFAGGKFRIKKWGRLKIEHELKGAGISNRCINSAIGEIDREDYVCTLKALLKKKGKEVTDSNLFKKRNKMARFAIGKGYEPELVWETIKDLTSDQ